MTRSFVRALATSALLLPVATGQEPAPEAAGRAVAGATAGAVAGPVAAGPLCCFSTYERPGDEHQTVLHLAACRGDRPARVFYRNRGNARLLARVDRARFVVASFGDPYALLLVDAERGEHRVLADGCAHGFVAVHGDDVLYIGDNRWGKGDNHLYARSLDDDDAPPRRLCEPPLEKAPLVVGNLLFAITAGEREVWAVSLLRGTGRRVYRAPEHAMMLRLALSPSGTRLAIGCNEGTSWTGHLAVVDLGSAKVLQQWSGLSIELPMESSFTPTVEPGFADDEHVACSESLPNGHCARVQRSIATGETTGCEDRGPLGLYHLPPVARAPRTADADGTGPTFSITTDHVEDQLRRTGQTAPVATTPSDRKGGSCIVLHPRGEFAVVRPAQAPERCELHRPERPPLPLFVGAPTDFVWFSACDDR